MDLSVQFTVMLLSLCYWTHPVMGSGSLYDPPSRHVMWKYKFPTPKNYTYREQNCGGEKQPGEGPKQCGICGYYVNGTTGNEQAGNPGTPVIGRYYPSGIKEFQVKVELMAFEGGFFEFRVCPANNQPVTQACLDEYLLPIKEGYVNGTPFRFYPKSAGDYRLTVAVPPNLTCNRCVLQWRYHTDNSWGVDTKTGIEGNGFGPPKEFYNCADIRIGGEIPDSVISNPFFAPEVIGLKPAAHSGAGNFDISVKPVNSPKIDHISPTTVSILQESGNSTSAKISTGNYSDTMVSEWSTTLDGLPGSAFSGDNLVSSLEFNSTSLETNIEARINASRSSDQTGYIQLQDGQVDTSNSAQTTAQTSTLNTDPAFTDRTSLKIGLLPVGAADVRPQVVNVGQPDSVTLETATLTVDIVRAQTNTNDRQSPGQTTRQIGKMDLTNDLRMDVSTSHGTSGFREISGISTPFKTSDLLSAEKSPTILDITASSMAGILSKEGILPDSDVKSSKSRINSQSLDTPSSVNQNSIDNSFIDSQSGSQVEQPYLNANLTGVNFSKGSVNTHKRIKTVEAVDANVGTESKATSMDMTLDLNTGSNILPRTDPLTRIDYVVQGEQNYAELAINRGSTPSEHFDTQNNAEPKSIDPTLAIHRPTAKSGENLSINTFNDISNNRRDIPASFTETTLDVNPDMEFLSNVPDNIQTIPDMSPVGGVIGVANSRNKETVSDVNVVGIGSNEIGMAPVLNVVGNVIVPSNVPNDMQNTQDVNLIGDVIGQTNIPDKVPTLSDLNFVDGARVPQDIPNYIKTSPDVNAVRGSTNIQNTVETLPDVHTVGNEIGPTNMLNNVKTEPRVNLVGGVSGRINAPQNIDTMLDVNLVRDGFGTLPNQMEVVSDVIQVGDLTDPTNLPSNMRTPSAVDITDPTNIGINIGETIEQTGTAKAGKQADGTFKESLANFKSSLTDFGLQGKKVELQSNRITDSSIRKTVSAKSSDLHPDQVILADGSLTQQIPYVDHSLEIQGESVQSLNSQINRQFLPGPNKETPIVKTATQPDQVLAVIPDNLSRNLQTLSGSQLDSTLPTNIETLVKKLSMNKLSGTAVSIAKSTNEIDINPNLQSINGNNLVNSILGDQKKLSLLLDLLQNSQLNKVDFGSQLTSLLDQNIIMDIVNKGNGNSQEIPHKNASPSIQRGTFENSGIQNNFASEPSAGVNNILEVPALSNIKIQPNLAVPKTKDDYIASSLTLDLQRGKQKTGNEVNNYTFISNQVNGSIQSSGQSTTSTAIQAMAMETSYNPSVVDLGKATSDVNPDIYIAAVPNAHTTSAQAPLDRGSNRVLIGGRKDISKSEFVSHGGSEINNLVPAMDVTDVASKSISSITPNSINLVNEKQTNIISAPLLPGKEPGISIQKEQIATGPTLVVDSINKQIDSNVKAVSVIEGVWSAPGIAQQDQMNKAGSTHSKDMGEFSINASLHSSGSLPYTNSEISVGSRSFKDPLPDINFAITESLTTGSTNLEPFTVDVASNRANSNVPSSIVDLSSNVDTSLGSTDSVLEKSRPSLESREIKLEPINNINIKNTDSQIKSVFPKESAAITQDIKPIETITTEAKTTSISGQGFGISQSSANPKQDGSSTSVTSGEQKSNTVDYVVAPGSDTTTDIMTFMKDVRATKELMNRKFQSKSKTGSTKIATTDQNIDIKQELRNFNMNDIPADSALGGNIQVGGDGVLTPRFGQRIDRTTRFRNLNRSPDTTNIRSRSTRNRERNALPNGQRVLIDPRTGLGSRLSSSLRDSISRSRRQGSSVSRDSLAEFRPSTSGDQTRSTSFPGGNSLRGGSSFERSRLSSSMPDSLLSAGRRRDSSRDVSRMGFSSFPPRRVTEGRRDRRPDGFLSTDFVRDVRPFDPTSFDLRFDPLSPFRSESRDRPPFGFVGRADEFLRGPQFSRDLIPRALERLPPSRFDGRRDQFGIGGELLLFDRSGFRGFPAGSPILSPPMDTGLFDPFMGGTLTPTGFSGF